MGERADFEITRSMRAGRAEEAHASMRAWRLEPLPEMRTVRVCVGEAMMGGVGAIRCRP
jgi:hypothetical protein